MPKNTVLVKQLIEARKTSKVLLPVELRAEQQALWQSEHKVILQEILQSAAWAPFHKRAHEQHCEGELKSPVPWRFYVLDGQACNDLLQFLEEQAQLHPDSKWSRAWQSKIKNMVAASGALVQVTWLPDPPEEASGAPEFSQKNIEHVAAAGSAVQNLLLAAQSHDWLSYWSSGGILRDEELFDQLNISRNEQLLGSVFLSPKAHPSARVMQGGLREQRGDVSDWMRWI